MQEFIATMSAQPGGIEPAAFSALIKDETAAGRPWPRRPPSNANNAYRKGDLPCLAKFKAQGLLDRPHLPRRRRVRDPHRRATIPSEPPRAWGRATFRSPLSGLLVIFGVVAVVRSFLVPGEPVGAFAWKPMVLVLVGTALFGALVGTLGLIAALLALVLTSAAASEKFQWDWRAALGLAALIAFCSLVFVKGLGVPMPLFGPGSSRCSALASPIRNGSMDIFSNLLLGFETAATFSNLGWCLAGVFLGTAIGVLPGLGPTATIAMLLPATFGLPPISALIMLAGIFYGAQYGGSTTAILVNLPGETIGRDRPRRLPDGASGLCRPHLRPPRSAPSSPEPSPRS